MSVAQFSQVTQFGQYFAKHNSGFDGPETPIHVVFQQRSVIRLVFADPIWMDKTCSFRREEDDQNEQHDYRLIDRHLLYANDEIEMHLKKTHRCQVADIVQLQDGRVFVHRHVGIRPTVGLRIKNQSSPQ